jgi:hypothetical protein
VAIALPLRFGPRPGCARKCIEDFRISLVSVSRPHEASLLLERPPKLRPVIRERFLLLIDFTLFLLGPVVKAVQDRLMRGRLACLS